MIIDHVALEVDDIDERVRRLEAAGLRVLRHGTRYSTGQRIVMMGDGTGNKLELIEADPGTGRGDTNNGGANDIETSNSGTDDGEVSDGGTGNAPVFAHLALRTDDVDGAHRRLQVGGYESCSEPHDLAAARARSALLDSGDGLLVQVISYADNSPDAVTWNPAEEG